MQHRLCVMVCGLALGLTATGEARRIPCEYRCGYRATLCVLERGGVDGAEIRTCRREAVRDCRTRGRRTCPLPTPQELTTTLAAVQGVEATVHQYPLCAAALPNVPVAGIDEAIAVGRDVGAALAGSTDPTFRQVGRGGFGSAFTKLFLGGFHGHGAAFVPLGHAVLGMARPSRAVTYADDLGAVVYGIVGVARGRATGLLLTYCPSTSG